MILAFLMSCGTACSCQHCQRTSCSGSSRAVMQCLIKLDDIPSLPGAPPTARLSMALSSPNVGSVGKYIHWNKWRNIDKQITIRQMKKKYLILTGDKFFFSCDFLPEWPLSTGEMHDTLTASQFSASEKGPGTFALEKNPLAQLWRLSTHNHILQPRHPFWHCHR